MAAAPNRRDVKVVDLQRKSPLSSGPKRRRKPFSYITIATFIAGLFLFFRGPFNIFAQPKQSGDLVSSKASVNDKGNGNSDHVSIDGKHEKGDVIRDEPLPVSNDDRQEDGTVMKNEPESASSANEPEETVVRTESGKCLKHILYDKPVKTGSTAIMFAIRKYLSDAGRGDRSCSAKKAPTCVDRGNLVCNGTVKEDERYSIIGHFQYGTKALVECLRPNYYVATSIREPYERRKSAYLWNRTLNATHFAIPHTATFQEFMERLPRCQLYHYYDGRGIKCDVGIPLEQRIEEIVGRVDEVIDIYDEPVGPLHKSISRYLGRENESIKIKEEDYVEDFDRDTLKEEQMLYKRLREARLKKPDPNRLPC